MGHDRATLAAAATAAACRCRGRRSGPSLGFGSSEPWLPQPAHWSELSVEAEEADHTSMLWLYRDALHIRRELAELHTDDHAWIELGEEVLAFTRGARFACVVNFGATAIELPQGEVLLSSVPLDDGTPANRRGGLDSPLDNSSPQQVVGDVEPQLRGEPQRLDVDSLVVAVEPSAEVGGIDVGTEQPGAVGDRAHVAVDARVGEADDQLRRRPSRGKRLCQRLARGCPTAALSDAADRRRVVHDHLDVDLVEQIAERGAQMRRDIVVVFARQACGRRRRCRRSRG